MTPALAPAPVSGAWSPWRHAPPEPHGHWSPGPGWCPWWRHVFYILIPDWQWPAPSKLWIFCDWDDSKQGQCLAEHVRVRAVWWRGWGWQLSWHSIIIDHRKFSSLFPNPNPWGGFSSSTSPRLASLSRLELKMKTRKVFTQISISRMKGCCECCYLVSTWPLSHPAFPVSLQHIYSAIDTPWNLSILVIHWHRSLSTLNNIYKYLWDLLCAGWPHWPVAGVPGDLVRARDTRTSDKVCYWQHLEKCKQTIRGRQREMEPQRTAALLWSQHLQMGLLWHLSLSHTGILSAPITGLSPI